MVRLFPSLTAARTARLGLRLTLAAAVVLTALAVGGAPRGTRAQTATTVLVAMNSNLNMNILTDPNGMTLYTFKNDTPDAGTSKCVGGCANTWPAFPPPAGDLTLPDGATGVLATITRDDGTMQVTYNGWPLYFYARDSNPGDSNGNGVGNVWFAALP